MPPSKRAAPASAAGGDKKTSKSQPTAAKTPTPINVDGKKLTSLPDDPWKVINRGITIAVRNDFWPIDAANPQETATKTSKCELVGYVDSYEFSDNTTPKHAPAYIIVLAKYHYPIRRAAVLKLLPVKHRTSERRQRRRDLQPWRDHRLQAHRQARTRRCEGLQLPAHGPAPWGRLRGRGYRADR